MESCVADQRNTSKAGVEMRVACWDALVDAKFVKRCTGSELSRKVTRYKATPKLLELREVWERRLTVEMSLARNTASRGPDAVCFGSTSHRQSPGDWQTAARG